ncbi:undecaprenyl pyrophosphate phosphatase [Slackia heliotrinireducens]|uniref:PAP2 superfamily protein n=1 Tax=Slackia heliotrinireducens (strain ATCC 29202 / DSM 20476 / NCTC 11029 / RHS 1) TaxID=471855 RepID=C7N3V6_SLAHD|nr:phosphatase PAP2 family protein [Slackia heliotrinireducens]ACV21697.1 PAP2 superfamily protein [Slackia heliotrinireducens DSM 20476]VEG99333.1 undecaprenyl pyrophosphate phosphatase [Slackia heliotrinireducens]
MEYPDFYNAITMSIRRDPKALAMIPKIDKDLVVVVAAVYIMVAISFVMEENWTPLVRYLAVPGVGFVLCTALRAAINAPRPVEKYGIDPIIKKDTSGKSFPSRHVFSATIIAFALFWLQPWWGGLGFVAVLVVCFTRIVGGVHFPRDVVAAVLLAAACALVGFVLIP